MKILLKIIFLIGFFTAASTGHSQVYQWKEADSRTVRFSNTAPQWYGNIQGESRGPRVQVYYFGVLVDDTNLTFEVRQAMRSQSPIGRYLPRLIVPSSQQAGR